MTLVIFTNLKILYHLSTGIHVSRDATPCWDIMIYRLRSNDDFLRVPTPPGRHVTMYRRPRLNDPFPQDVHYMRSARTQFLASFLRRCLRFWLDFRHQHFECRYFEIGFLLYNEIQIVYLYSLSMSPIMCFSDRTRGKKNVLVGQNTMYE